MLNTEAIIELAESVLINDPEKDKYVVGKGITTGMAWGFKPNGIEENKGLIANYLKELGLDEKEKPYISARDLMTLKDGTLWNELQTYEDYTALDYLLAMACACGFIDNSQGTEIMNVNFIGEGNSIFISRHGREFAGNDKDWLDAIKESCIDHMHYVVNVSGIKEYSSQQK